MKVLDQLSIVGITSNVISASEHKYLRRKKVSSNSNRIIEINYRKKYKYAYLLLTTFADPS